MVLGDGLLPLDLEKDRDETMIAYGAAYASVSDSRAKNFRLWHQVRSRVTQDLQVRFVGAGLTAPPFDWDRFWMRVDMPVPSRNPPSHVALVRALQTNYQQRFCDHIRYRLEHEGNVHLTFSGPTGMGKSSCAIALADWIKTIEPAALTSHLSFDLSELASKLASKRPGETVIQDEYTHGAGEGTLTVRKLFENLEDTLRASQVNLFRLSPREQEKGTMQAQLECILWNPEQHFSVFLVWLDDTPAGLVALPWARAELYSIYKPWKDANVARSQAGQFKDNSYLARNAMELFDDSRFTTFLLEATNKPKAGDFRVALELFHGQMLTTGQAEKLVAFMFNICVNYDRLSHKFEEWFATQPSPGLKELAEKWYKE